MVLWGADENDKKILVALELKAEENQVNIYTFSEEIATEALYTEMMDKWRNNEEVSFPDGHQTLSRPLSLTEDLLPETIKVERTDLIARARTEWQFVILSGKLYEMYKSEVGDFGERIGKLIDYDQGIWDEMKGFWTKVQNQIIERNLFREHATDLKQETNKLFDQLKEKKAAFNEEFKKSSKIVMDTFTVKMEEIETKIEKGLGLKPIFEELKQIQADFKNQNMTRGDRNKVWNRLDKAFKDVKEKRFGDRAGGPSNNNNASRLESRYNGLLNAINKMEQSIKRDKNDQKFQTKRIETTDGQLELQIRQAKMQMIEERILSKQEKLNEMMQTKTSLEAKIASEKQKQEARDQKATEKKEIAKAKKVVKEKIATQIKEDAKTRDESKLEQAAENINSAKAKKAKNTKTAKKEDAPAEVKKKETADVKEDKAKGKETAAASLTADEAATPPLKDEGIIAAITNTIEDTVEDVVDTVKAVASVVEDKVEASIKDAKKDSGDDKTAEDGDEKSSGLLGSITAAVSSTIDDVVESVKEMGEVVEEQVDKTVSSVTEDNDVAGKDDKKAGGLLGSLTAAVSEKVDDAIAGAKDLAEKLEDKVEESSENKAEDAPKDSKKSDGIKKAAGVGLLGAITAAVGSTIDDAIDQAKEIADNLEAKVDDISTPSDEEE